MIHRALLRSLGGTRTWKEVTQGGLDTPDSGAALQGLPTSWGNTAGLGDKLFGSDSSCPPSLVTLVGCITSPAKPPQGSLPGDGAQGCGSEARKPNVFLCWKEHCETREGAGCQLCSRCLGDTSEPKNEISHSWVYIPVERGCKQKADDIRSLCIRLEEPSVMGRGAARLG